MRVQYLQRCTLKDLNVAIVLVICDAMILMGERHIDLHSRLKYTAAQRPHHLLAPVRVRVVGRMHYLKVLAQPHTDELFQQPSVVSTVEVHGK